jgi:hypothetical protein
MGEEDILTAVVIMDIRGKENALRAAAAAS